MHLNCVFTLLFLLEKKLVFAEDTLKLENVWKNSTTSIEILSYTWPVPTYPKTSFQMHADGPVVCPLYIAQYINTLPTLVLHRS